MAELWHKYEIARTWVPGVGTYATAVEVTEDGAFLGKLVTWPGLGDLVDLLIDEDSLDPFVPAPADWETLIIRDLGEIGTPARGVAA